MKSMATAASFLLLACGTAQSVELVVGGGFESPIVGAPAS